MARKDLTLRYAVIQFCFWVCFAGIVAFSSVYLLDRGLTNTGIGVMIAISGALAALLQPLMGSLMDRFPRLTSPALLAGIFALLVADALALILVPGLSLVWTALFYGLMVLVAQLCQSLLNVIGVDSMSHGNTVNFNTARAIGSLGYAVAAWGIGEMAAKLPLFTVPLTVAVSAGIIVVIAGTYPLKGAEDGKRERLADEATGPIAFLKEYPVFLILLPALTMIYFGHSVLNTFTLQIVRRFGAGSAEMGTATAIAAICELVTVLCFAFYRKHFRITGLLCFSGIVFTLKVVLSAVAQSVFAFDLAPACQMFAWGIMCVAIVYYVNETIPEKDRAKGQTYAGMTLTAANVISGVIGGRMIDTLGIGSLITVGIVVSACGSALMILAMTRKEKKEQVC